MADIFISFVHEEAAVAEALQGYIAESYSSQRVFLSADQWQVFAGEVWLDRIRQELEPAKIVVLVLSPRSVSRAWVNFEAGAAWLTNKMIIPACIGDLDKGSLPKPYSNLQALNLPKSEIQWQHFRPDPTPSTEVEEARHRASSRHHRV